MYVAVLAVTEGQSAFAAVVAFGAAVEEYDAVEAGVVSDFVETVVGISAVAGEDHEDKIDCLLAEQGSATAGAADEVGTHTHFAN